MSALARGSRPVAFSLLLIGALAVLAVLTGRLSLPEWGGAPGSGASARPSIVILSLDTLRADHLSSYGYSRPTSPRLDDFAADSVRFASALAQATGTLPSHLSLFTSLNPPHFRITRKDGKNTTQPRTRLRLPGAVTTLAEALRDQGYETAAFTNGGPMNARYGHDQGFDRYVVDRSEGLRTTLKTLAMHLDRRARVRAKRSETEPPSPLFLFVHTFDVHEPYQAPEPFSRAFSRGSFNDFQRALGVQLLPGVLDRHIGRLTPEDVDEVRALYDNGIAWVDDSVAALFDLLDDHGLYEDAIIVVLSDHGEEFLDHGALGHGATVYQELVHVPLVIRLPEGRHAGRVVDEPVALVDVAPTVLELADLVIPPEFEGTSLLALIENPENAPRFAERPVYFESPRAETGPHGLRRGRWKLIRNASDGSVELYDLSQDPEERDDLAGQDIAVRDELSALLVGWVAEMEETGRTQGWFAVPQGRGPTKQEREALRALGYVE